MKQISINEPAAIDHAIQVLSEGGLIIFPTETTYGAGVDATNPEAVAKLLAYKSRREGKPLSIAVPTMAAAEMYVDLNDQAKKIYAQHLPGPVTVVSHAKKEQLAPGVTSEFGTVGVRIPDYDFMLKLLQAYGKPITATSANASGKKRPYTIQTIFNHLSAKQKNLIDLVLNAGTLPSNPPSTVIDTTSATPLTLRKGSIAFSNAKSHDSHSESDTKKLVGKLLLKHWNAIKDTGLVITLDGPLGAGKTICAKGVADFLNISDELVSPTYTYMEEYDWLRHAVAGKLFHLDLWRVDSSDVLQRLELETLFGPQRVVVIEWWDQVAPFAEELNFKLPKPSLHLKLADTGQSQRNISFVEQDV